MFLKTHFQHSLSRFSKFQPTRKWVLNKVNLSRFSTQNVFHIRACAQKAKHLDVTRLFTYSHANIPLSQSEHVYYLSYFINIKKWNKYPFIYQKPEKGTPFRVEPPCIGHHREYISPPCPIYAAQNNNQVAKGTFNEACFKGCQTLPEKLWRAAPTLFFKPATLL